MIALFIIAAIILGFALSHLWRPKRPTEYLYPADCEYDEVNDEY